MSLYSHMFHRHTGTGPWTWTCPAGKLAIVKYLSAVNPTANVGQTVAKIGSDNVWVANTPANGAAYNAGLHIVFYSGDVLTLLNTIAGNTAYAAGYLLDESPAEAAARIELQAAATSSATPLPA